MTDWYMLTLLGRDRPGIVAGVTKALFETGVNLGETSMIRLGDHFTVMMMVSGNVAQAKLESILQPVCDDLQLRLHIDAVDAHLHRHLIPNIQITVSGADRAGIIAQVAEKALDCGVNIIDLESDVAGTEDAPVYILQIGGVVDRAIESVAEQMAKLEAAGVSIRVSSIDTYLA